MAVAEMKVLTLIGLNEDKNAVLDALFKSGAAQIKTSGEYELTSKAAAADTDGISADIERVERAITTISAAENQLPKEERVAVEKDGFGVTKEQFFAVADERERVSEILGEVERATERRADLKARAEKLKADIRSLEPYLCLNESFSYYSDTKKACVFLGVMPSDKFNAFIEKSAENGVIAELLGVKNGETTVCAVAHKEDKTTAEELLTKSAFKRSPFSGEMKASVETARLEAEIADIEKEREKLLATVCSFAGEVGKLKLYSDYLGFMKEKLAAGDNFAETARAFVLEAYVPTEAEDRVESAIKSLPAATFTTYATVGRDEFAPTLNRNGRLVENFEAVTNMYSAPAYGALDPNAVMSFFFSLFMGVIMADVGYGILMFVGGLLFARTQRDGTSVNRMAKVFAFGGVFAVLFGVLFDSWLGFPLLRKVLGEGYNAFYSAHLDQITANASLAGINVPAILMWCLGLGTAQIGVGLILKAVQCFSRRQFVEGVFGGLVWAVAMFALIVWVYGIATGTTAMSTYGLYVLVGAVAIGVLTAGIGEKGFAVFTKSFSSAYGLINYVSDILSYARLYGLMLSGAQIASIFTNTLAIGMLFPLGVGGVIAGVILIIVGNVFNLAINLLGAYIHDARLQYVEFYGKFYEGEGELFTPIGSRTQHTYFKSEI